MSIFSLNTATGPTVWYVAGVLFFIFLEYIIPFRTTILSRVRRWRINFVMNFYNVLIVDICFVTLLMKLPAFSGESHLNFFNVLHFNTFWRLACTVLILDLAIYVWHRLNHVIPFLWRFHRVHHTDLNLDISSAARFHFGEVTGSAIITYTVMLLLGATIVEVRLFQVALFLMAQFEHSNIKLNKYLEAFLLKLFVSPDMHRIHHSNIKQHTDSNYGTIFSFWDRIFRSYTGNVDQDKIVFGLKEFEDPKELMLFQLLALPFKGMFAGQRGENNLNNNEDKSVS